MTALPSCRSKADVVRQSGTRCLVVGVYRQIDVRMRKQPPPQYRGHAGIELADGTLISLEPSWSKAAIRSENERAQFEGKQVEVTGVVHASAPPPPEPAAHLMMPAISPVDSVALSH